MPAAFRALERYFRAQMKSKPRPGMTISTAPTHTSPEKGYTQSRDSVLTAMRVGVAKGTSGGSFKFTGFRVRGFKELLGTRR